MWNTEIKSKKIGLGNPPFFLRRTFLITAGIGSIAVSFLVLGFSLYEGFLGAGNMRMLQLPGFHELQLDSPGLYGGVYQHRGAGPMPIKELTQMDVRVMSKDDYEEIPVLMNSTGQTFDRFGMHGLPLFNFAISRPGAYTLSGVYAGGATGPDIRVLLAAQSAGNIKQTLFVGVAFFVFFLGIGVFALVKLKQGSPKKDLTTL